jgi:hypothetical protein
MAFSKPPTSAMRLPDSAIRHRVDRLPAFTAGSSDQDDFFTPICAPPDTRIASNGQQDQRLLQRRPD